MDARRKARKRALDILHTADVVERDVLVIMKEAPEDVPPFARELIEGVAANRAEIDDTIRRFAERWELERMPVVDRNLIRIGIFELLHRTDIPPGATINEVVELAKLLSTPDSGRFVNGLLGRVARESGRA